MRNLLLLWGLIPFIGGCGLRTTTRWPPPGDIVESLELDPGLDIYYRSFGKDDRAIPVILLHGIPDSSFTWIPIVREIGRNRLVLAPDLPGYGYSNWPDGNDFSLGAQADYLLAFMNRLRIKKAVVVGHDIGGGIAQIFAARNPGRVDRMVLINTVALDNWPVWEVRALKIPIFGPAFLALFERPIWNHILKKGFYDASKITEQVRLNSPGWFQGRRGRKRLVRNARALFRRDTDGLGSNLKQHGIPTLVLWGREDKFLDDKPAVELCRQIGTCDFEYVPEAGHFVLDEKPLEIAHRIERFLREPPSSSDSISLRQ